MRLAKEVLEFVDSPKKLWIHLKTEFRNLFFERLIVEKQMERLCETRKDLTLDKLIDTIQEHNKNSGFIKFVNRKLGKFQIEALDVGVSSEKHFKRIFQEIFKYWFLEKFNEVFLRTKEEKNENEEIENVDSRQKGSKIINYENEGEGNKIEGNSQRRLEKVTDFESFF